jgi:putative ABC transport system permease protein
MIRVVASLVTLVIMISLSGGMIVGGFAQDAVTPTTREAPPRASTCIRVRSIRPADGAEADGGQAPRVIRYGLHYSELERILASVPQVGKALPIRELSAPIRHRNRTIDGRVVGTTCDYAPFARLGDSTLGDRRAGSRRGQGWGYGNAHQGGDRAVPSGG